MTSADNRGKVNKNILLYMQQYEKDLAVMSIKKGRHPKD
jgi:hypothetical protein